MNDDSAASAPPRLAPPPSSFKRWLFGDRALGETSPHSHRTYPWWQVMCLTGVDYFSTLGYQPGIAFLAAGVLSPIATLVLVAVTLFVALPIYAEVAARSPHGQGSFRMLEDLLPRWRGKVFVLVLLGFAFTDFILMITLSAADATAHIVENPFAPRWLEPHRVPLTLLLLSLLGAIFLKGVRAAMGLAVGIVAAYLALNAVVLALSFRQLLAEPLLWRGWIEKLTMIYGDPWSMIGRALIVFPSLALGLSGLETSVAVVPLVRGGPHDTREQPAVRIRNARKMLAVAACLMSVFLLGSSVATTTLIPTVALAPGGEADGRALAWLAHAQLGHAFGTVYDLGTILILWFAGASAFAGLLTLVPRYLPPYGMAPDWARAQRPLVLVLLGLTFIVTWRFQADVVAQSGAYATGVLFLMTSAALAVTIAYRGTRAGWMYGAMTLVFLYTFVDNVVARPVGLKIAAMFIALIVATSLVSRAMRATELTRIERIELGPKAFVFIDDIARERQPVRIVAHRPDKRTVEEYDRKERQAREDHSLDAGEPLLFLEVTQGDASDFSEELNVRGVDLGRHRILRCKSPAIPNAIAALLIHVRDTTGMIPHAYFGWTEGNPLLYVLRYLALGEGDTAPVTREILRRAIKNPIDRPRIHVG